MNGKEGIENELVGILGSSDLLVKGPRVKDFEVDGLSPSWVAFSV